VPKPLIALATVDFECDKMIYKPFGKEIDTSVVDFSANGTVCSTLLFAIGNDHSGSYYPVAREALPFIIEVALYGNHLVARNCAVNILIDLYYFGPHVCRYDDADELMEYVKSTIRGVIEKHREVFLKLISLDIRNKALIENLLCIGDEQD